MRLGIGRLRQELPRDGKPHSLRIAADGYAPTTLLFVDAPPPRHIALEPLARATRAGSERPSPSPDEATLEVADEPGAGVPAPAPRTGSRRPNPPARAKRAAAASPARSERPAQETESEIVESDAPARASAPNIQIIEDDTPVVQVIE